MGRVYIYSVFKSDILHKAEYRNISVKLWEEEKRCTMLLEILNVLKSEMTIAYIFTVINTVKIRIYCIYKNITKKGARMDAYKILFHPTQSCNQALR